MFWKNCCSWQPFFFFTTANRFLRLSSNFSDAPLCWSRAKNPELKIQIPVRTYNIMKWQDGGVDLSPYYDLITLWKEVSRATYCKHFPGRWHISEVVVMKVWRWCKCITHGLSLTCTILQDLTQDPPLQIFCLVQPGVSRAYTIPSNMTTKWCDIKKLSRNGPVKDFGVKKKKYCQKAAKTRLLVKCEVVRIVALLLCLSHFFFLWKIDKKFCTSPFLLHFH